MKTGNEREEELGCVQEKMRHRGFFAVRVLQPDVRVRDLGSVVLIHLFNKQTNNLGLARKPGTSGSSDNSPVTFSVEVSRCKRQRPH